MLNDGIIEKHHPSSDKKGINQILPYNNQRTKDDIRRKQAINEELETFNFYRPPERTPSEIAADNQDIPEPDVIVDENFVFPVKNREKSTNILRKDGRKDYDVFGRNGPRVDPYGKL